MATESGNNALASSMTDLMTSLMVIFVLLLVATLNNTQQEAAETRSKILSEMQKQLDRELVQYKERGFEVKTDPKDPLGLIVVVPEGLLNFAVNRDEIPPAGVAFLQQIIPKMAGTVCAQEFRSDMSSIVVEGHSDRTGSDEINLPLSQARSMSVVRASLQILRNNGSRGCFLDLVSATGRGSVEPMFDGNNQEDAGRSRRVIFKIRVRSLEQKVVNRTVRSLEPQTTP